MFSFKRLLIPTVVAASIFLAAGCSSNQATTQDQTSTQQQGYGQQTQQPTSQPAQQTQASYQDISADQAKQLIDSDKTLQIIDVREQSEYSDGHIAGAKLIPVDQLASRISEIDKTKPVLVYCLSGARSAEASQVLAQSGYTKVYNLGGGINGWSYGVVK